MNSKTIEDVIIETMHYVRTHREAPQMPNSVIIQEVTKALIQDGNRRNDCNEE